MPRRFRRLMGVAAAIVTVGAGCGASDVGHDALENGAPVRIAYGDHVDAFGDFWPSAADGVSPVVVLVHGGFWRDGFSLDLMDPLIPTLVEQGYAVWNIEYRRVGAGGGHPETFIDAAAAVDHLAQLPGDLADSIDLTRVAVVGHSAGGHLAAWVAGRGSLQAGDVGAEPAVPVKVVVAQAGVLDLVGCAEAGVGGSACVDLLGARPDDEPERYVATSPTEMVPFDAVVIAVHGDRDRIVPPTQSETFVDRAVAAGMDATYVSIPDADHLANLDPHHPAWKAVLDALDLRL